MQAFFNVNGERILNTKW